MTENKIQLHISDEDKAWADEAAADLGMGRATLIRVILRRVRKLGDGDPLSGLAKLQMAHEHGLLSPDSETDGLLYGEPTSSADEDGEDESSPLDAFKSD